jgi:hypothetical protein
MPSSGPSRTPRLVPVFCILAAPIVAGAFVSTGWSWGWDHLVRAVPVWRFTVLALAALVWIHPVRNFLERAADGAGARLTRDPLRLPLLLSLVGLVVFAACPIATRIYGDSRYILDDHSSASLGVSVKKMLSLGLQSRGAASFVLHDLLARATGLSYERCYMLVSILCGGLFLFAHARFAAKIPGISPSGRAVILWLGLTDGANQLFFGHVENYTVARLFACLFLMGIVRSLLDAGTPPRRLRTLLWLALAVFFHAQWLILVPTAVLWLGQGLARGRPSLRPWVGGRAVAIGLATALAALAVVYVAVGSTCYDYIYSGGRPHPRQIFLPISTACIGAPYLRYTLFSGSHLADWAGSLYSISSPAVLFSILMFLRRGVRRRIDAVETSSTPWESGFTVLLPAVVFGLLHNFVLNSAIGFPFDWDLMCLVSPPLLYAAVFLVGSSTKASSPAPVAPPSIRPIVPALFFLGLATLTLFGVNASPRRVYHRVEDMGVWLHRTYFGGSHYRLSSNLSTVADRELQARERARVLERLMPDVYPGDWEIGFLWERLALERIKLEDYDGAKEAYESALRVEPAKWSRMKPLGYLETEIGDSQRGIRLLKDYLAKAPADAEARLFLGDASGRAGDLDEARTSWSRFLELAPSDPEAARVREQLRRVDGAPPSGPR